MFDTIAGWFDLSCGSHNIPLALNRLLDSSHMMSRIHPTLKQKRHVKELGGKSAFVIFEESGGCQQKR